MYDDLDLPFASLRLLPKGGHGGHNGCVLAFYHLKINGCVTIRNLEILVVYPIH